MTLANILLLDLKVQHRHDDGSWATFEAVPSGPDDYDPERDWPNGTIYRCTRCDEEIVVSTEDPAVPD